MWRKLFLSLLALATTMTALAADKEIDPTKLKDKVTIALGKKSAVQFQRKGNKLSAPKVVEKATDDPPTLTFDFRKQDDNLMLMSKNPFKKDLKFRAAMRLKGQKEYIETSIVPVRAELLSFEVWGDPIEELVLFDFSLIDAEKE
jgi:hypothetical protein